MNVLRFIGKAVLLYLEFAVAEIILTLLWIYWRSKHE